MNPAGEHTCTAITGASSGIGRATAIRLAGRGVRLFLTGRRTDALAATAAACVAAGGPEPDTEPLDVRDADRLAAWIARTARDGGTLGALVNAAGVLHPGAIVDGDVDQWREMFDTNVVSTLVAAGAAIRAMRATGTPGTIVNVSSTASASATDGVYGATKAAVDAVGAALRHEVSADPIRIVTVTPGNTATNAARHFPPDALARWLAAAGIDAPVRPGEPLSDDLLDRVQRALPDYLIRADDVARAIDYALAQPPGVDVSDVTVRPRRAFDLG